MMMLQLLLATMAVAASVAATPDNLSSRLMVHIPHSLFQDNGYDHIPALFGVPSYGGSIAQFMYYANSDLCDPNVDTRQGYPQRETDKDGRMKPWQSPYILMVDRGGCTFVQKVRNAQRSGASGVIIADNTCLCNDIECTTKNGGFCETSEPIMTDDGSGADVSIPSFLMYKVGADAVKAELINNRHVLMELAWAQPISKYRVEYELWTTPTDIISKDFLRSFKVVAEALGDRAYFTPHMAIHDGLRFHCQGHDGANLCDHLCTNNGRYCATESYSNLYHGIQGADIIRESLRRMCIWRHYGATNGVGSIWWDYVREFIDRCNSPDFFTNNDCIQDIYGHAKVDGDLIEQCMQASGGLQRDSSNAILDVERDGQAQQGVVVVPIAFVNNDAIHGALTISNVFMAICAKYDPETAPPICTKCSDCHDVFHCIKKNGRCPVHHTEEDGSCNDSSFSLVLFASMLFIMGVYAALGALHHKKAQEVRTGNDENIEYMSLNNESTK